MKKRAQLVCGVMASAGLVMGAVSGSFAVAQPADKAWIAKSNGYTQQLLDVQLKHAPERGSRQGERQRRLQAVSSL